jgi:hypothetical protein
MLATQVPSTWSLKALHRISDSASKTQLPFSEKVMVTQPSPHVWNAPDPSGALVGAPAGAWHPMTERMTAPPPLVVQ